ncbi:MAG: type IV toxin-antitoxin system AbiEi family antitoxin domain-containing protein [Deltaproteobacteria bacterium]|nr:type IV toxin-antitoxin system AbiEi family antitoxin domain-containing protein [Deltaproteobacteria bacterium]
MEVTDFFHEHPVFTYEEFVAFIDKQKHRSVRARQKVLSWHAKKGRILRVRRGLYCTVMPGVDPAKCPVDPLLVAARLTKDAILGYHTALEFHGKAHSLHQQFTYLTASRSNRHFRFRSFSFRAVLFPKSLRDNNSEDFAVEWVDRSGVGVRVTSLERTLVDMLDRPDLGGGWEEIWRSLGSVEYFDLDQVVDYALVLRNSTTTAKVGFFLEQHREVLMVEDVHLRHLRERRPRRPHYMGRRTAKNGRLVAEWNLVVPRDILERPWERTP